MDGWVVQARRLLPCNPYRLEALYRPHGQKTLKDWERSAEVDANGTSAAATAERCHDPEFRTGNFHHRHRAFRLDNL